MLALLIFLVVGLLICLKLFKVSKSFISTRNALTSIPGPACSLIDGNLNLFYGQNRALTSEIFFNTLKALARIYHKEGIFKLRFGNKFIVCVFQSRHLKNIISSNENISKSVEYDFLNEWLGDGLLLASGKNWRKKRALLAKAFHKNALRKFCNVFNKKVDIFLEEIGVDLFMDTAKTFKFTVEIISETLFKSALSGQENETYLECIHQMVSTFTTRAVNPLLWGEYLFKLTSTGKTFYTALKRLKQISKGLIQERHSKLWQSSLIEEDENCLLDILLRPSRVKLSQNFLDKVSQEVDTFLFAGHDTTALSINWILYLLGQYPEEQAKVRDEIQAEIKQSKAIKIGDLDRLVYLDCFVKECLRLHPPVPIIGRHIEKEISLSEHTIPKDVMLYILIDQLQLESDNFDSPHSFIPGRFLGNIPNLSYMPFSAGPRNCIGKRFALMLIKLLLVKMLRRYEIHSEGTADEIETSYNIVLKPKHELKIRLCKFADQTLTSDQ